MTGGCVGLWLHVHAGTAPVGARAFDRAVVAGWGSVDVLTSSVFRESCAFYFSGEALRARDFRLASRVEFDTPAAGVLENVRGLCAKVLMLGCVRVRSLVKVGETLEVHAGTFTSETPLKRIKARGRGTGDRPSNELSVRPPS